MAKGPNKPADGPDPVHATSAEQARLDENGGPAPWHRWGPYVSERQWGTVREDYSPHGTAWDYFPHDHARSRAYRWGEDGIGGICDRRGILNFAVALWNGKDPILKERMFGLTNSEGNHGEDVKDYYFYLDSTPTHSYMKMLYKYPHAEFPYARLVEENRARTQHDPEFELLDTGVFDEDRYFDVFIEYAKASPEDICIRITAFNRGPETAPLVLLPTLWYRNTWSWADTLRPAMLLEAGAIRAPIDQAGERFLYIDGPEEIVFTENETNTQRLYGVPSLSQHVKDAFHDYVIHGNGEAVGQRSGSKVAAIFRHDIAPGSSCTVQLRLADAETKDPFGFSYHDTFNLRKAEADQFYDTVSNNPIADCRLVQRQAFAGMMWSKQIYYYDVREWLRGDPAEPPPPAERLHARNSNWLTFSAAEPLSMPDKWEYPWFAAWDLAFHCIPITMIDPDFAKQQLLVLLREWYMHPNGQIPAYEWSFSDVNPPVHAWSAWRVYTIDRRLKGVGDKEFLSRAFHKLLLNFTWWVNRKDSHDNNVFEGGFLGLDNIGVFDRNTPMSNGTQIEQSDGTSWMAMFCLNMLTIALELARFDPAYEDVASKFFEHFVYIAEAMNNMGPDEVGLWDEDDGFYYDVLRFSNGTHERIKVRSMVGLIPIFAIATLESSDLNEFPGFRRRMKWFLEHRPDLTANIACTETTGDSERRLLALVNPIRLKRLLSRMLDESEFLSPHGLRALSRTYRDAPYMVSLDGMQFSIDYEPGESTTGLFGGNSNWRGPVWFPLNYLMLESLQKFHYYLGDDFKVECPTGSGIMKTLWEVSLDLDQRLIGIFTRDETGKRPVHGNRAKFQADPHWRDLVLFYEYFNGDNGSGVGANHQTGWTGVVAKLVDQLSIWQ